MAIVITQDLVNAMVATSFNLAAAGIPELRSGHPNGMTPAYAAMLPKAVRAGWLASYLRRIDEGKVLNGLHSREQVDMALAITSHAVYWGQA